MDRLNKTSYEIILSITKGEELSWKQLADCQPALHVEEFSELEEVVKRNPEFIAAMAKRGLHDPSLWMVYVFNWPSFFQTELFIFKVFFSNWHIL